MADKKAILVNAKANEGLAAPEKPGQTQQEGRRASQRGRVRPGGQRPSRLAA